MATVIRLSINLYLKIFVNLFSTDVSRFAALQCSGLNLITVAFYVIPICAFCTDETIKHIDEALSVKLIDFRIPA